MSLRRKFYLPTILCEIIVLTFIFSNSAFAKLINEEDTHLSVHNTVIATPTPKPSIPPDYEALGLVNKISSSCGGRILPSNYGCLQSTHLPAWVINTLAFDSKYKKAPIQCGMFIQAVLGYVGKPTLNLSWTALSTWNRYKYSQQNYRALDNTSSLKITVGDVAIWSSGAYGHIGYVTRVYNTAEFQAAEANFSEGLVDVRTYDKNGGPLHLIGVLRQK